MRLLKLLFFTLFISVSTLNAQTGWQPNQKELHGNLSFLSSPLLEGRESGERGGFIAAEYIASMMETYGLQPVGDAETYFQNFNIVRTKSGSYSAELHLPQAKVKLENGIDFTAKDVCRNLDLEASIVFAGYGLSFPEYGYDSYKGIDVKGKIVVILDGTPNLPTNQTSTSYKAIKAIENANTSFDAKRSMAIQHGAIAMLVVNLNGDIHTKSHAVNRKLVNESYSGKLFPTYENYSYSLTSDGIAENMPCFTLSKHASKLLFANEGIDLNEVNSKLDKSGSAAIALKPIKVRLSSSVENEPVGVRNVLGMIKGVDSTKYIVVSAHYDHLGRRGDAIYNGADDNASGVSGMLSIAKYWAGKAEKPACNIIFASWTAEEVGMLGSKYFVQNFSSVKERVLLNINFDMISRNDDTDDLENKTLYVGILKGRNDHKQMVVDNSNKLGKPFIIDPWETSGNGGSDYISFSVHMIPVMAFFSGMHKDYHLPVDTKDKIDMDRMVRIITIANGCLTQFLQEEVK